MQAAERPAGIEAAEPTFITFSDAAYFVGTLALLNSLRLSGNSGELVVVDVGLEAAQRAQLGQAARVVGVPAEVRGTHTLALKPSVYLLRPTGVIVLVDSDMIVTRNLDEFVELARGGKIVAFPDHRSQHDRWFAEWQELFELKAPPRRQQYVNAGLVVLSVDRRPGFLERWFDAARRIPPDWIQRDPSNPGWAADQDALNAILMSEVAREDVWIGPEWESIHPDGLPHVEIVNPDTLRCLYGGNPTVALHFSLTPKPWQRSAWRRIRYGDAYVRLLPRVLCGDDVVVRPAPEQLPVWARKGIAPQAASRALGLGVSSAFGAKRVALKARDAARRRLPLSRIS